MSSRMLSLLELADECPELTELRPYLDSDDAEVRRTALSVLSETTEEWAAASAVIAAALTDIDAGVRRTAMELLAELREVLVAGDEFAVALRAGAAGADASVRATAIGALWRHRLTTTAELSQWLTDAEVDVRREAVLGLVSLDALDALAVAAADDEPLVRISVAKAVAAIGDPRGVQTLVQLAADPEPLVRAAALAGMEHTGCDEHATTMAVAGLCDDAWQVRAGAAAALAAADADDAVGPLSLASRDDNLDVRKAAVRALAEHFAYRPDVRDVLTAAHDDPDADVRAYARMGITEGSRNGAGQ
jgi:HEAT repeat protein